ncbi:MAG: hypothetical protein PHN66_02145 [Candidatus Shapirobacteria bacterium]|nr:hypothetical protein [Candidatus Shapirobacteria bacterium]
MKNKNKSKEYESVYICDFCDMEFSTNKKADEHELNCEKNPQNKDVVLTITSNKFVTVCIVLFFLYISTYFIANVNAQSNGISSRDLLQPQKWFSSKEKNSNVIVNVTPTSIPTFTPTVKPTSAPKKVQSNTTTNNNSNQIECIGPDGKHFNTSIDECKKLNEKWGKSADYTVDCNVNSNCGGGTKKILKSECDNSTCCQVGSNWIFYTSKQKCDQDQKNNNSGSNNTNTTTSSSYPSCTIYYPLLGYSRTYNNTPPQECQSWQQQASSVNKTPTPYATPTMTEAQAQLIINQYNSQVKQCRNQVNEYYHQQMENCAIRFGGGSAMEACTSTIQRQWNQATNNCGQLY